MSDNKSKWDTPTNVAAAPLDEAGDLAKKHGISPDRAQMLIDRLGHDPQTLAAAAESVRVNKRT